LADFYPTAGGGGRHFGHGLRDQRSGQRAPDPPAGGRRGVHRGGERRERERQDNGRSDALHRCVLRIAQRQGYQRGCHAIRRQTAQAEGHGAVSCADGSAVHGDCGLGIRRIVSAGVFGPGVDNVLVYPSGLIRRQLDLQPLQPRRGDGSTRGRELRRAPFYCGDAVLRGHRRIDQLLTQAAAVKIIRQAEANYFLLAVVKHDVVVTLHQIETASRQRAALADLVTRQLVGQGFTKRPGELCPHLHLIFPGTVAVIGT